MPANTEQALREARNTLHAIRMGHHVDITATIERIDATLSPSPSPQDRREAVARKLCEMAGHDPDGGPRRGFGYIDYLSDADAILTTLEASGADTVTWQRFVDAAQARFNAGIALPGDENWLTAAHPKPEPVETQPEASRSPVSEERAEIERLMHVIDRDRYAVAVVLNNIKKVIAGYAWLSEPGRGSYSYDDERYQLEFGDALRAIEATYGPLTRVAWDKTDCTTDPAMVNAARAAGAERAREWMESAAAIRQLSSQDEGAGSD